MAISRDFYNIASPNSTRPNLYTNPYAGSYVPEGAFSFDTIERDSGSLLDFLGSTLWGAASAVTWGVSDFINPYADTPWEEKSGAERAGMIMGEGLGLFLPFGAFGQMARAGRAVTRLGANKFVGKAAKDVADNITRKSITKNFDAPTANRIIEKAEEIAKAKGISVDDAIKGFGDDVYAAIQKTSKNDLTVGWIKNLRSQGRALDEAKENLVGTGGSAISRAFKEHGIELTKLDATNLAGRWVDDLAAGHYVDDIAEWTARALGGAAPGRVRSGVTKYLGMATQDMAMMTAHGLISGAVKSHAYGEHFDPMETLSHSGKMALAFPLIRLLPGGGNDNLTTGFKAYFGRYKNIDYGKIQAEHGDDVVNNLLRLMVSPSGKRSVWNSNKLGTAWWTVGKGKTKEIYKGADDILARIKNGTMNVEHTKVLLNKINKQVSSEMLGKWGPKYLADLGKSLPRMAAGTLVMNPWVLDKNAWSDMDSSELGAHMMMSFMMVKGRGAWGHKNKRQYFADFKPYTEAMRILGVDADGAKMLFRFKQWKDGEGFATGEHLAGSETGQKILTAFDKGLEGGEKNPTGKHSADNPDLKLVQQFADMYDIMNITKNPDAKSLSDRILFLSEGTINKIANNIREISIGVDKGTGEIQTLGQKGTDAWFHAMIRMTGEPLNKAMNLYKRMFAELNELGFDISVSSDGKITYAETRSVGEDGVDLGMIHNINRVLDIFRNNGDASRIQPGVKAERTMEWIAKANNMDVEQLKARVSEVIEKNMSELSLTFANKGKFIMPDSNQFMKFYTGAKAVATNERLFDIITGKSKNVKDKDLTTLLDKIFMIDGKYHADINEYKRVIEEYVRDAKEGTPESKVKEEADLILHTLKPLFDLRKVHLGGQTTKSPNRKIERADLQVANDSFISLFKALPREFQADFKGKVGEAYLDRIYHNIGLDSRALKAAHYAQSKRLGVLRDGKFQIPSEEALKQYLLDEGFSQGEIQLMLKGRKSLKDVLGDTVKETDIIPVHDDGTLLTEGIDIQDYARVYKFLGNDALMDLMGKAKTALEKAYNLDGGAPAKLNSIQAKITNIIDSLDPEKEVTVKDPIKEIESIIAELDAFAKAAKRPNAEGKDRTATEKDVDEMIITLNELKSNISKQTSKWTYPIKKLLTQEQRDKFDQEGDRWGVREAILEPLQNRVADIFKREYQGLNHLNNLIVKIENLALEGKAGYGLGENDFQAVMDKLVNNWNVLFTKDVNKQKRSLSEVIEQVNERGLFGEAVELFKEINKEINKRVILNNPDHVLNEEMSLIRKSQDEGRAMHERHKTPIEVLREYGLVDKKNKIDEGFKAALLADDVKAFNDYILNHINQRTDSNGQPLSSSERVALYRQFKERHAIEILSYIENQQSVPTVKIIGYGEGKRAITLFNNDTPSVTYPGRTYFGDKKLKVIYLDDGINVEIAGKLRSGSLDQLISNPVEVQKIINNSIRESAANKEVLRKLAETYELSESEVASLLKQENIKDFFYYVRVSPKNRVLFARTKENIENLNNDFESWFVATEKRLKDANKNKELDNFRNIFGQLRDKTKPEDVGARHLVELKLMLPYIDIQGGRQGFDQFLGDWTAGDKANLQKIQMNIFKRGNLTDGGTTQPMSKRVLNWIVSTENIPGTKLARVMGHPNKKVRDAALKALKQDGHDTVVFDESTVKGDINHPLNIQGITQRQIESKISDVNAQIAKNVNKVQNKILQGVLLQNQENLQNLKSLDNSLFDGAKFASLDFMRLVMAHKGENIDNFLNKPNGAKTIIFATGDNQMLGKGFLIYHPDIAQYMPKGADIIIGSESAKSFTGKTPITNRDLKPTDVSKGLDRLHMAQDQNRMIIPIKSIGISFVSKNAKGGVISPSIFDFQSPTVMKEAMQWMKFQDKFLQIANEWGGIEQDPGGYTKWLYGINEAEGNPLNLGDQGLARLVFEYGVSPSSPIIMPAIKRLMRSQNYKDLKQAHVRGGEDNFIVPNVNSDLAVPIFAKFTEMRAGHIDRFNKNRTTIQYGETSINRNQSRRLLGKHDGVSNIVDETFIFRDHNGIDVIVRWNGNKFIYESPFYDHIKMHKGHDIETWDGATGSKKYEGDLFKKGYNMDSKSFKSRQKRIEVTLNEINKKVQKHGLNYSDVIRLMDGNTITKNGKVVKLTKRAITDAQELKLAFGMLGHAIPALGHDKVILRVGKVLKQMNGLAEINVHDLRTVLQRDNDGDHFYMHQKLPEGILKAFARQNGKKDDFRMFDVQDVIGQENYINIFGIGDGGKAGEIATDVGFHSYASKLSQAKMAIGQVVGIRNALSWLDKLGMQLDGKDLLKKFSNEDKLSLDSPEWKWLSKFYDTMQNSVDIHGGIHRIMRAQADLMDFLFFGTPKNYKDKAQQLKKRGETDDIFNKYAVDDVNVFGKDHPNFGKNNTLEKEMFFEVVRLLKKANMVQNDVYDEAGSRNPEAREIKDIYGRMSEFFLNPTRYLSKRMMNRISYYRTIGKKAEADLMLSEYVDMFYGKDYMDFVKNEATRKQIYRKIYTGEPVTLGKIRFRFENVPTIDALSDKTDNNPFFMSIGGRTIYDLNQNKAWFTTNFEGLRSLDNGKNFQKAGIFVDRIENFVEVIRAFGQDPVEILTGRTATGEYEFALNLKSFGQTDPKRYRKQMNNGILRNLLEKQHDDVINSFDYFMNEPFANPNKIQKLQHRLANLKQAMDIMDVQLARDMVIRDPKNQIIVGKKNGQIKIKNVLKAAKRDRVAIYAIKGDVDVTEINKLNKEGKEGNLNHGKTDENYISHNQLKFLGYYTKSNIRDNIRTHKGMTYIIDTRPKKMVNLSENEMRWSRALFEVTRDEVMSPSAHMDNWVQFTADARALRFKISTGYRGAIKESLTNRVLSKDIYEMQALREGIDIKNFLDKWVPQVHTNIDPVDLILRYLLQPQLVESYAIGKDNQYIPTFKTDLHLQKTILNWTLNNERIIETDYGGDAGFAKRLMKQVQLAFTGKKKPNVPEWESSQTIGIDYKNLGELANPVKSLSRYLDIFYSSTLLDMQLDKRTNTTRNRVVLEKGPDNTSVPTVKGRVINRHTKPADLRDRYHDIESGGKIC